MTNEETTEDSLSEETSARKVSSSGKTREQIQAEIRAMAEQSKQHAQGKLFSALPDSKDDTEDELEGVAFSIQNVADRDESHRLYFSMYNVMKRNLPKGKSNEPLRRHVYDEVLLYLNQGKRKDARGIRNSSGQMAYIPSVLQPAWAIVMDWVAKGANPFELYSAFEAQNIALGYHSSKSTSSSASLDMTSGLTSSLPFISSTEATAEDK